MKKIILTALGATILMSGVTSSYALSETADYSEKQSYEQKKSSDMRLEYYNKYKAKGYDVSLITSDILDSTKTSEDKFWYVLKVVQNNHEVPDRRSYVAKLKSNWYDVSAFNESIIWDSGKFWELVKITESVKKVSTEVKKEVEKKIESWKEDIKSKIEEKKIEFKTKIEEKKPEVVSKMNQPQIEKLKLLMKERISKLPTTTREATLIRLESNLEKNIESAKSKNAKLLVLRYEALLSVVQDEMTSMDDETLINSIFQ